MKAILIDALKKEVREVESPDDFMETRRHLNCDGLELVRLIPDKDSPVVDIYIDEFGQGKDIGVVGSFKVTGIPHPIIGNGLVVGTEIWTGEMIDTHLSVDDVKKMVVFL